MSTTTGELVDTDSLFAPPHRRMMTGICLLLATNAFEIVGSATAMPAVLEDLGGRERYGWAVAAPTVGSVLGSAIGGKLADRLGAWRTLFVGLGLFVAGLVLISSADSMTAVTIGRLIMGVGGGISFTLHLVLISRYLPDGLAPKAIAAASTVFVVPGLVGPTIVGVVVEASSWRWVFAGVLPVVAICLVLLEPELRRRPELIGSEADDAPELAWWGPVVLTIGIAVTVVAASFAGVIATVVAALAVAVVVFGALRSFPRGTFSGGEGLPAAVCCALFVCLGYLTAEAYLPLLLREVRDQPLWLAGMPLTVAALFWTSGAWIQSRVPRTSRRRVARWCAVAASLGTGLTALAVVPAVPSGIVYPATAIAAFGCGLLFTLTQQVAVESAAPGREGEATGGVQLANMLGIAIGTSLVGILLARVDDLELVLTIALVGSSVAALLAVVPSRRLPQ